MAQTIVQEGSKIRTETQLHRTVIMDGVEIRPTVAILCRITTESEEAGVTIRTGGTRAEVVTVTIMLTEMVPIIISLLTRIKTNSLCLITAAMVYSINRMVGRITDGVAT